MVLCVTTLSLNTATATAAVPANFEDTFVTSVSGPIDMVWTPDGRMIIINKGGQVMVYANGTLLPTPALDLSAKLCTVGEQGLVGITLHPNFASNHYVYLYYIYNKFNNACPESEIDGPVGRFSRFVLPATNLIDPASEVVLFETPPRYRNHHTGGDPKFGKDGYIYVVVGDAGGQSLGWPQNLGILAGKVVRITDTGGIPADNPFTGPGTARCNVNGVPPAGSPPGTKCQEIYAYGLRNPFRQAMDPNTTGVHFYIDDVGQHSWEEISEGPIAGANYGWEVREGPCAKDSDTDCGLPPAGMADPIHWYHHGPDGGAVTGGAFVPTGVWPASYDGKYLFADYVFGKIYMLEPGGANCRLCLPPTSAFNQVEFATIAQVVSLRFGPYGTGQALYYATRNGSEIRRIAFTGTSNRAPIASATANPTFGLLPLMVQFDGSASSDPDGDPLTYEWDFENDGTPDSTAVAPTHQYTVSGVYTSKLTVRDGKGGENSTTIRIDAGNTPPVPTIDTPTDGTLFAVGDHFVLHGSATDPEEGTLPSSALTWQVLKHHATHTHPFLEPTTGNDIEIIAPEPEDLDAASTSYLEIRLTATDSNGLTQTVTRDLRPKFVDLTFQTNPPGLQLAIGGATFTGPSTVQFWEGANLSVNAPDQTDSSGNFWKFDSWSDGGAASHAILTPSIASTYTASFTTSQVLTFAPSADTYIEAGLPDTNFGSASRLLVDNSPVRNILMKFNVSGGGANTVASAKLRLYCLDGSSIGGSFYRVANNAWSEGTVTWNNAPAADANSMASLGTVAAGIWYEVDLTSLVSGDGTVSIRVTSLSSNGADYSSKEGTAGFAPQLLVTLVSGSGSTSTPTPTATSTNVSTATQTPTSIPTSAPTNTQTSTPTSTLVNTPTPTTTPSSGPLTLLAVADSYVRETKPSTNYGNAIILRVDSSPVDRSYLRFNVQGLNGAVTRATLRIFTSNSSNIGYEAHSISDNTWGELTINYNNAPAVGALLGSSGAISANTWTSIDVTSFIRGNGVFNLALITSSTTAMSFSSRQGTNSPQLVIETQDGPTPTPTSTPTYTATFTPTNTPTNTPTATATNPNSPTNTPTYTPTSTATPTPTNPPSGNPFTFIPIADAYVNESNPTTNYGNSISLRADGSPFVRSYLRFNVQGLSGTVTRATLRVFANTASNLGCNANIVSDNTWSESTINYNNAPSIGSVLGSSGSFGAGVWISMDVTAYVTGNGTYNLGLTNPSSTAISFASRESGVNAPQLIIETSP